MKRLTVFFLVILFLVISPIAILAELPENDLESSYSLLMGQITFGDDEYFADLPPLYDLDYGQLYSLYFSYNRTSTPLDRTIGLAFNLSFSFTSNSDFYFLNNLTSELGHQFSLNLLSILDENENPIEFDQSLSSSFSYSGDYTYFNFLYNEDECIDNGSGVASTTRDLYFTKVSNIPSGTYYFIFVAQISDYRTFHLPLGFFIDNSTSGSNAPGLSGDPVSDFQNGFIDFQSAANGIISNMNDVLDDPSSSDFQKQFAVSIAQLELSQLKLLSDEKYSPVVSTFFERSFHYISQLTWESRDIAQIPFLIENLNYDYADALTKATTAEQGILISSQYSAVLQQMQNVFDVKYKSELDSVITSSEMGEKEQDYEKLNELLELEDSVRDLFDSSDYQAYFDFQSWILDLEDDPSVYRTLFDFFFDDPRAKVIQPYLVIPFSLVVVGVILGTTTVVLGGRKHG